MRVLGGQTVTAGSMPVLWVNPGVENEKEWEEEDEKEEE
jgi:hypothetical protein